MRKIYFLILVLIFSTLNIPAFGVSDTIFTEGFENGEIPDNWSNVMVVGHLGVLVPWHYTMDGYKVGSISYYPDTTAFGVYNARFDFQSYNHEATKLVTPKFNMTGRSKIVLSFWHAQSTWDWSGPLWDVLKVYYKKDSVWNLLESYDVAVEDWVKHEILIPDNALSSNFYIGFEATTNYGYGVCIDDVKLIETGSELRYIYSVNSSQPDQSYVPTGTTKNIILRTDIFVAGNNSNKLLQWMDIKSMNSSDADIVSSGVKIYYTSDTLFDTKTLLGSGSFSAGNAHITLGNKALKTGNNSVWVTYDVKTTATPKNTLDARIEASKISISDSLYPATAQSPSGSRIIKETMFFDDFETNKGWTLFGDFERRKPQGLGGYRGAGSWGAKDPSEAFSDTTIIGTDLSGLPTAGVPAQKGNYEYSATAYSTYAISPTINCHYYKNVTLRLQRQLSVYRFDNAEIDISTDDGSTWTSFWTNEKSYSEDHWGQQIISLTDYADRYQQVKVRFSIGPAGSLNKAAGWNIDDFIFMGDYITKDVGVEEWLTPKTSCGLGTNETVSVVVRNFANVASVSTIPLKYTINGTTFYSDTLRRSIPANDTVHFAFSHKYNFSTYDYYNTIYTSTALSSDEDTRNDGIYTSLYSLPSYTLPHFDNFDNAIDFWLPGPAGLHDTWERGTPSKSVIKTVASIPNAWVTKLYFYEAYPNSDSSYIESPCYDFSNVVKPIFEFKYTSDLEATKDGVALYYSIDNGSSWHFAPKHSYSWRWNWYTCNNISALKTAGWDTLTNGNWITAKQVLPSILAGQPNVKFRFLFMSDSVNAYDGFGVDDVNIYEAPAIAGMKSINSHHTACQNVNPDKISFSIKNNGIRTIYPTKDTIFAGFKINTNSSILDTIQLTDSVRVGDTLMLTFHKNADVNTPGAYNIKVFTINRNRNFYPIPDTDTLQINITINANPVTNLADTFRTARLDTLTIYPDYSSNYTYRWSNATHDPLSTAATLHAPPPGKIWLKVTNSVTSCTITDTFYVRKMVPNVGVKTLIDPHNACELGSNVYFKFSIKNYGDDTMRVNDTIKVGYRINSGSIKYENHKVTSRFYPGDTIVHTFTSSPADFTTPGSYTIKAFTAYKYDSVHGNDTLNSTVHVWGYPTVNIGPDTTVVGFYTLHAGTTFKTYLWDNKPAETANSYLVRNIGYHWVYVTDSHDCPAYDTAYIVVHIHDLKPLRISGPLSDCSIGTNKKVKLTISNCGTDTVNTAETIPAGYSLDGGTWVNETIPLSVPLLPGDSIEHQFNQNENFSAIKTYTFRASVNLTGDIDPSNDSITDHVYVYGYPIVNLGPDTTVKAVQYTLSAPVGATYAYLWQNDSTYRQYHVTATGKYYVRVTETLHNCVSSDTANITLSILDGSITETSTNFGCSNAFDSLQVRFMNKGNINIPTTDSITLACKINGASPIYTKHKLTVPLAPNGTFWHTFKNLSKKVNTDINNFKIYPVIPGDLRPENDTLSEVFTIYQPPTVNLGGINDTIKTRPPHVLDAGAGTGYTYLWQDLSTNRTLTVTTQGYKNVRVTNDKGCIGRDTVFVYFLLYDGGITNINGVSSACAGNFNQFQATFTNLGEMPIASGDTIKFNYKLNGLGPYSFVYRLIVTLNPGEKVNYTFMNLKNRVIIGLNKFKVYSITKTDDYPVDDTMNYNVTIDSLPVVNLENGKDTAGFKTNHTLDAGAGFTSYLWNTLETTRTINISNPGWYKVTVTNSKGCHNKDSVYMTNTAINSVNIDKDLHVFPNPANRFLNIEIINAGLEDPVIEVFSTDMKLIFTYTFSGRYEVFTKTMDVRNWKPGLYYFRIADYKNNKYYFRKVVIE